MHDDLAVEDSAAATADDASESLVAARLTRDVIDPRVIVDVLPGARERTRRTIRSDAPGSRSRTSTSLRIRRPPRST